MFKKNDIVYLTRAVKYGKNKIKRGTDFFVVSESNDSVICTDGESNILFKFDDYLLVDDRDRVPFTFEFFLRIINKIVWYCILVSLSYLLWLIWRSM